jgi:TolB protein
MRPVAPALAVFLLMLPVGVRGQAPPGSLDPIVFVCGRDICVIDPDGSSPTRLTSSDNWTQHSDPAWSPDGTRIIYSCGGRTCVMSRDGANVSTLTNNGVVPSWAPDGTKIAVVRLFPGNFEVMVMNADGSGVTVLPAGTLAATQGAE